MDEDKENVLYTQNGFFNLRKEGNFAICDNRDEPEDIRLIDIRKHRKTDAT